MAFLTLLTCFISFSLALFFWLKLRNRSSKQRRPPGPPGWPIVGNMFDLETHPHLDFYRLGSQYGPVLWLKLGNLNTLVVNSAAAAAELFTKHDLSFADRTVPNSMTACDYVGGSLAEAAYGDYWRILRRLSVSELMVQKRIHSSVHLRQKCVDKMIEWMKADASSGPIQLDKYLLIMSFNLVSSFMLSRDVMDLKSETGNEFFEEMTKFMSWQGKPNVADAFGFLKRLDPQGIRRHTEKHLQHLLRLVSAFVEERIVDRKLGKGNGAPDFLDALLDYRGDGKGSVDKLSVKNITIVILEMFFGGTESTSVTTVWAMAELLRNPNSMNKLKAEIDETTNASRSVEEDDLNELKYLQAVVKETMRLHPAFPLLLPRKAREDAEFMGYSIPKGTTVMVNAWAIHRDPDRWEDPLSFKPERFLNSSIDLKGKNYGMIPFGSGRRSCVGMLMGDKMISLSLARLIQCFDWELPGNMSPEEVDMREMVGISLRMLTPLKALPKERGA